MAKIEEFKRESGEAASKSSPLEERGAHYLEADGKGLSKNSEARSEDKNDKNKDKGKNGNNEPSYFQEHPYALWILVAVVIAGISAGVVAWRYYSVRETTDDAQVEGDIVPVAARVAGTVQSIDVRDNQVVEQGQVLVQLDPRDYQAALAKAEADLADAQATAQAARVSVPIASATTYGQLDTARANLAAAQNQVDEARAGLAQAQANYKRAADDLKRYQALVSKDEIPRQTFDAAVTAEQSTRAQVDSAQAAIAASESRVLQAEAQLRASSAAPEQVSATKSKASAAEAAVSRSQAAVEIARLNLEYTTVKAPFSGLISRKTVEPGQILMPGQPLMSLVSLDNAWVIANYKENQLKDMRIGQKANVHVDAFERNYTGHVESISGATAGSFSLLPAENATGNFVKVVQRIPVKIVFDKGQDPQHLLRPGMSAEPTVVTGGQ